MNNQNSDTTMAIGGFDAVAYFNEGRAIQGDKAYAVVHDDSTWLFSSEKNAQTFRSDPERYAPAYSGRCAFATSLGQDAPGDPRRWAVRGGRLFFNSNAVAHGLWKVVPGRISAADKKWSVRS